MMNQLMILLLTTIALFFSITLNNIFFFLKSIFCYQEIRFWMKNRQRMILNRVGQCVSFISKKLGIDIEHSYSQRLKKATQTLQAEK